MALRPNLRQLFRNVTVEEYAIIATAAKDRLAHDENDRAEYPVPQEANESLIGALVWSSFVAWQDYPMFVVVGVLGSVISTGCSVYRLFV